MTSQQDDSELHGPARLAAPRLPVVRRNRRVLDVIGETLVVLVLGGLAALGAQGLCLAQDTNSQASRVPPPAGERWFDQVPDCEPLAQPASRRARPAPALPPASPPPAKTRSETESADVCRERPDPGSHRGPGSRRRPSAGATLRGAAAGPSGSPFSGSPPSGEPPRGEGGPIIAAFLLTGVSSDLPGHLIAQVCENVFDTETRQHVLVPQGGLIGLHDHQQGAYGQERVLVTWYELRRNREGGAGERRGCYGKIKSHLTCGASQRGVWTSREARPFRGTSWLARTRAARRV